MDDGTYVRRRRWSSEEKRAVVTEAMSSGNVIAMAKRHGIQAQQIHRWRERLEERQGQTAFLPVSIAADSKPPAPTSVLDQDNSPAAMLDRSPRVEIDRRYSGADCARIHCIDLRCSASPCF